MKIDLLISNLLNEADLVTKEYNEWLSALEDFKKDNIKYYEAREELIENVNNLIDKLFKNYYDYEYEFDTCYDQLQDYALVNFNIKDIKKDAQIYHIHEDITKILTPAFEDEFLDGGMSELTVYSFNHLRTLFSKVKDKEIKKYFDRIDKHKFNPAETLKEELYKLKQEFDKYIKLIKTPIKNANKYTRSFELKPGKNYMDAFKAKEYDIPFEEDLNLGIGVSVSFTNWPKI